MSERPPRAVRSHTPGWDTSRFGTPPAPSRPFNLYPDENAVKAPTTHAEPLKPQDPTQPENAP